MHKLSNNRKAYESAGGMLRYWRKINRISQLDLAFEVGVSPKHLSFVETGKSQPSRKLILKMAHTLKLPLRQRNTFLKLAGFAPEFGEAPFGGEKMGLIRQALERMLKKQEPYPALVVNTGYRILMTNSGFDQMVHYYLGKDALKKYDNVYRLTFAKDGLRQYIKGWPVVEQFMLARLWEEGVSTQNPELMALYEEMSRLRSGGDPVALEIDSDLPIMSLHLEKGALKTSFFTTITTLGTPLDLTTQELRIESLFPADEETKQMFPLEV